MFVVKAFRQGNSICLSIPSKICHELGFSYADYFQCGALDTATIKFEKMSALHKSLKDESLKGEFTHAYHERLNRKHSRKSHRSKPRTS